MIRNRAKRRADVSLGVERLGDFLASRGQPGDAEKALSHYERSLKVRGSEDLLPCPGKVDS
jgi:hypothetical protein